MSVSLRGFSILGGLDEGEPRDQTLDVESTTHKLPALFQGAGNPRNATSKLGIRSIKERYYNMGHIHAR